MSQQELLAEVASTLRSLGVEFMLTGSLASSLHGQFRATHDIDPVANFSQAHVQRLIDAFSSDRFYLSPTAVADAIRDQRMFNLLETKTGDKVDFWVLTKSPFDQSRFARRQCIEIDGQIVDVSSPEDTILMKLLWAKKSGGSEKQMNDVLRVYELQSALLDISYITTWVRELEIDPLWQRVLDEADLFTPPEAN